MESHTVIPTKVEVTEETTTAAAAVETEITEAATAAAAAAKATVTVTTATTPAATSPKATATKQRNTATTKMAENCPKCKKSMNSKDAIIICNSDDCLRKFHRACVNIDDDVYDIIQKHPQISFNCDECRNQSPKALAAKLQTMEEKLNKVCNGVNQIQGRMYQQYFQFGNNTNNLDGKKQAHNLIVVGNNCNSDRLQVVCDYGRWVQVGKFATNTSEDDIVEHLAEELKINKNLVKCTKLVKNDANLSQLSYCKFKISIPDYRFNELFNEAIWPSGVMVSPFTPRSQLNQNRI